MDSRRLGIAAVLLATAVATLMGLPRASYAAPCGVDTAAAAATNAFYAAGQSTCDGALAPTEEAGALPQSSTPAEVWVWQPICNAHGPYTTGGQGLCDSTVACPEGEQLMRRYRIRPLPHIESGITCMPTSVANKPEITPALVLEAFRRIPLPAPATVVQPAGRTLVNLDTVFHTDAGSFDRTITLLGQQVHLAIRPSSFSWGFGDGSTTTTTTPGAAYPSKLVVHRYQDADTGVDTHVVITWSADYSVDGGPMQPVPGTAQTTGPDTHLRIVEAIPALSGAGH